MSDQTGGPLDSGFMSGHTRTESENKTVAAEAKRENRATKVPQSDSEAYVSSQQNYPRSSGARHVHARSPVPSNGHAERLRKLEPPVTKGTLSELDVGKILHNPKLRHDINFDPELHFRPNLDGEKGRRKQEKANQFWSTFQDELVQFVTDRDEFLQKYGRDDTWCLPSLLTAVSDIIQTLVPTRDRDLLNEGFNVKLLMQQFNRGVVDLEKLASWLSSVLKLHCAPMRDEWVDEMYNQLSRGNRDNDMGELVKGMRSLLSVLEAMKLDVANHQIRCLRGVLIDDTVSFERRFFHKKIQTRKLDITGARDWYRHAVEHSVVTNGRQRQAFGEMVYFFEGLAKLLRPSADRKEVPTTFLFDEERMLKLRSDMHDAVYLEICMRLYEQMEYPSALASFKRSAPLPAYVAADDEHGLRASGSTEFNFNAPPASSRTSSMAFGCSPDSAHSSPRTSACFFAPPQPIDFAEARARSRNLYSSLVALLHTAPSSRQEQRWRNLVPMLAVQIFRFLSPQQQSSLEEVENALGAAFVSTSPLYREIEKSFVDRLISELARRVKDFKNMSLPDLFSVATGGRIHGPGRAWDGVRDAQREQQVSDGSARDPREEAGIEDMATRLAHLGVLHWRVWADLVYNQEMDMDVDSSYETGAMDASPA